MNASTLIMLGFAASLGLGNLLFVAACWPAKSPAADLAEPWTGSAHGKGLGNAWSRRR